MVSSDLKQAAGIMRKQKKSKRWQKGFWGLAIAVVAGTVAILTLTGQALTHKTKLLNCQLEVHEHTDDCYDEEDNLICGYADYVVHVHNDDCYDSDGNLVCTLPEKEEHEHEEACYEEQQILICEAAEEAGAEGHTHTEECYGTEQGGLTCGKEEHTHDDSCYSHESVLACDKEEHGHGDECYDENGELVCGNEEHSHGDECYQTNEVCICGMEEHTHDDSCNGAQEQVWICGKEETESVAGHTHTEECYKTEKVLVCGELELHTHEEALVEDGGCYEEDAFDEETGEFIEGSLPVCGLLQLEEHTHGEDCFEVVELTEEEIGSHAHSAKCYDEDGNLICGYEEPVEEKAHEHDASCYAEDGSLTCGYEDAKDHQHDVNCYDENGYVTCGYKGVKAHEHDAECYDAEGNQICGYEGVKDHQHDADCYDIFNNLICGYKEVADHEHTESCYDEDGNLICGYEVLEAYELSKTFECDDYIVVARYNTDANLPEEAALLVETITADSDGEHYGNREAEYREMTGDADASMRALLKIGFYDEKGEEIEPEASVSVAVQFLDEDGLAEGKPITIIHFAEEGTEKLNGSKAKNNSTTFKMESFSEIAIGYGEEEESRIGEDGSIRLSDSFEQEADPFRIIFHVEGDAKLVKDQDTLSENKWEEAIPVWPEEEGQPKAEESGKEAVTPETDENEPVSTPEEEGALTEISQDETDSVEGDSENQLEGDNATAALTSKDSKLKFHVEFLEEGSELYEAVKKYVGESDETVTRRILQALTYSMTYDGAELDLSECKVTAEIIPEETLIEEVEGLAGTEEDSEVAYSLTALGVSEDISDDIRVKELESVELEEKLDDVAVEAKPQMLKMDVALDSNIMALADESTANPTFIVQYYAYAQIMATENPGGAEAIPIIDTVQNGQDGVFGGAQLPTNTTKPATRNMYVVPANEGPYTDEWPVYNPAYISKDSTDSLTKIYTADLYEFKEASGGLAHINKFAKDGLNYDLYEVWVLKDKTKVDSTTIDGTNKDGWDVYRGEQIKKLVFRNNDTTGDDEISIQITKDTVIRLVGRSNTAVDKQYPVRFFDYDFTDGTDAQELYDGKNGKKAANINLQGINSPLNYERNGKPKYGFGNNSSSGTTGLKDEKLDGHNINVARTPAKTIIEKCSFGLVNSKLSSEGFPVLKPDAPDLFNPQAKNVNGREEISERKLSFNRDGDTYTLTSVVGSEKHAQNLDQFQKRPQKAYGTDDQIWTNQFWPMDNAPTFGDTANRHDPKFGRVVYTTKDKWGGTLEHSIGGLAVSDDKKDHNSFFGMNFEVEFELTEDYVGPLNYYFFGDDDMWVFLEYPDGTTQLICDIGGVHQAAGEYVDLWNYIRKPEDNLENKDNNSNGSSNSNADESNQEDDRVKPKYKLKFFYTERGASGSTCWMQFTLPSVNAVPVIDYTGNVKSTLTLGKTVEGEPTNQRFDFTIEFSGEAANIATNDYPYRIKNKDGKLIESGDIRSGGTFKLGHEETIEVFNLPDNTKYVIKETNHAGYDPDLGDKNTSGTITKDQTVEGNIDWKKDDIVDYINKEVAYELPETGGPGAGDYAKVGAILAILAVASCFSYFKRKSIRGDGQ